MSKKGRPYGGAHFSRGSLYQLLKNPVYTGKISHKGTIHEGLHDTIISNELWDEVQEKLQDQSAHDRGITHQNHKSLLKGLIFDEYGNHYTPSFTDKKGKKYHYYYNPTLAEDKNHPNHARSRFPTHEIEKTIETKLRQEIGQLCKNIDPEIKNYIIKNSSQIPTYELVRPCVERVIVHYDRIQFKVKFGQFHKLVKKQFNMDIPSSDHTFKVNISYKTKRGKTGATIIKPEGQDIFDIPPENLKRLIQGVIWRDEHFAGAQMKVIAKRENCSDRYVRKVIMQSFDTLLSI